MSSHLHSSPLLSDIVQRVSCCTLSLFKCPACLESLCQRLADIIFSIKSFFQHCLLVFIVFISVSVKQQQ